MPLNPLSPAETNVEDNRETWSKYAWPEGGDEWSKGYGGSDAMWYGLLMPRIHRFIPCGHILEIAPGYGRCTQYLRKLCDHMTIVDITQRCLDACRGRFGDGRIHYVLNDGKTLEAVADRSVDFAFSWDSLVHVDHGPVQSYVRELARVLKPGAHLFIHHSNLGMHAEEIAALPKPPELGNRRVTMSAAKFAEDCREAGIRCLVQELVPQNPPYLNDCFSLAVRDEAGAGLPPHVFERRDWGQEVKMIRHVADHYRPAPPAPVEVRAGAEPAVVTVPAGGAPVACKGPA